MKKHLYDVIRERRSVRNFLEKEVPSDSLQRVLESARWAPSGGNGQAWSFGIIKDKAIIKNLTKAAGEQEWISTAPVVIACCAKLQTATEETEFSREVNSLRWGKETTDWLYNAPNDYSRGLLYSNSNNHIPGAHIQLAAKAEGLDTCWVGYLDIDKASKILNLPDGWKCFYLIPLGYGNYETKSKRKALSEITFSEQWNNPWKEAVEAEEFGEIVIRELRKGEESEWLRLWGEVAAESLAWQALHHKKPDYARKHFELVATLNGRIIGFMFTEIEEEAGELGLLERSRCGFVWELGVVKEHRRKKIADMLIQKTKKWLEEHSVYRMEFWSQEKQSQIFYEKYGMEEIQRHWQFYTGLSKTIKKELKKDKLGIYYAFGSCPENNLDQIKEKYEVKSLYGTPPTICKGYNYEFERS